MGRAPNSKPSYLPHRKTGKARMTVRDYAGARRDILLPGPFGSRESRDEYNRICAILKANDGRLPETRGAADLTIAELVLRFMNHAAGYYVDPETKAPTSEISCLRLAFRPLNRLFGADSVLDFDSLKLESLQAAMATGAWLTDAERQKREKQNRLCSWARSTVNSHIARVKMLFRWGCAKKLVPANNLVNLEAVPGLKQHRSKARETAPVLPIDPQTVEAILPHLPPVPGDIVKVLLLSGARVGELCRLRTGDLDRSGPVWLYRVTKHKTLHHGHTRTIAFGPRCQLILRRYLKADPDAFLFSPTEADRLRKIDMRAKRRTKVQPCQRDRSKARPQRKPSACFNPPTINHAIRRACIKAGVPIWHTHMLRHTASLLVMREHGIEAARSVLGHKTLNMTLHYSGIDLERAKEVMAKIG